VLEELFRVPEVSFRHPERALWAVPLLLVVVAAGRRARAPATALRASLCLALLAVALDPVVSDAIVREGRTLVVADVSPSMGDEGLRGEEAWLAGARHPFALARFGATAGPVVEAPAGGASLAPDPRMATDLPAALRLAAAWAAGARPRRIVLLSDGRSTVAGSEAEAERLRRAGVELWAVPLPAPSPGPDEADLRLLALRLPTPEEARGEFEVSAEVVAAAPARALATLFLDGASAATREVALPAGASRIAFGKASLPPGTHVVQVLLDGGADPLLGAATGIVRVPGTPRVLLLAASDRRTLLGRALAAQGFEVSVAAAASRPALDGFDAVAILPDALARDVEAMQEALAAFVGRDGGGLLAVGGAEGPGLARLRESPASFLLPLEMDPRDAPPPPRSDKPGDRPKVEVVEERRQAYPISLCLLVDRSGSMEGDKLERAKQAAAAAAAALTKDDRIAVVAFSDAPQVLVDPRRAGDPEPVRRGLDAMRADGNTAMFAALDAGYRILEREPSPIRHLVLLSDGRSTDDGRWKDLVTSMAERKITLSTIAIGFDVDPIRMNRLAEWGGGTCWSANHAHEVPQIVTLDARRVVGARDRRGRDAERPAPEREEPRETPAPEPPRESPAPRAAVRLVPDPTVPREAFRGLEDDALPEVASPERGRPRFLAWVAARAGDDGPPALAYWRYGLGTVAALTVDPEAASERALREHAELARIVAQLFRSLLPDAPRDPFEFRHEVRGEDGEDRFSLWVVGEDGQARTDLDVALSWVDSGEGGGDRALRPERRGGRYEAALPRGAGPGRVRVRAEGVERTFVVARSRPLEAKRRGADRDALVRLAGDASRLDPAARDALAPPVWTERRPRRLTLPFLLLAAILLPLDAWARRSSGSR